MASIAAVDARSGRELWRTSVPATVLSGRPDIRDGTLHVGGATGCSARELVHFNPETGERIRPNTVGTGLVDAVALDNLDVGAEGAGHEKSAFDPSGLPRFQVVARDTATKGVRWTTPVSGYFTPMLMAKEGVIVAIEQSEADLSMRVLSADDGRVLWRISDDRRYPMDQGLPFSLDQQAQLIGGGAIYVFQRSMIEARDARTGETRWARAADPPVAVGDDIVVARKGKDLFAFDHRGGKLWERSSALIGMSDVFLSLVQGTVFIAESDGRLNCPSG